MRDRSNYPEIKTLRYYSLVEMLMVMAIIAILVGIGAGGYTVGRRWLAQSRTEGLLAKIKIAIESYKNDKGYYPLPHTDPAETDITKIPCLKLDTNNIDYIPSVKPTDAERSPKNNLNNFMDYSKIKNDQSFKVKDGNWNYYYVKDAWNSPLISSQRSTLIDGNSYEFGPIKYRCPGLVNKTSFDLYSAGNDREFGTQDDIYAD